ncbi:efflux RND transporter periplasmic adaptor subunit [Marinobacter sp. OP 3.4]|uniref:efflux RND transporter periplasmic adaptor subunit n=1 Tax=Marinobacter sp. OP 3.4 TaxID=3076501 RepID=UPI002E21D471
MSQGRSFFSRWVSDPRYASAWVLALLVLALVFIYRGAPDTVTHTPRLESPEFRVHTVERTPVTLTLHSQGTARARDRLALTFRAGGEVVEVSESMASGNWVEKGELLVRLDPEPFELEVAQRRHDVESAKLHLEQAQAKATIARRSPSRNATDFALNVPQLREARARVQMARAALNQAIGDLERATMKAPFSGRLEQVRVSEGQTVGGGESVGELFSSRRMEVRLPVRNEWLDLMAVFPQEPEQALDIPVRLRGSFGGRERHWDGMITRRESGVSSNQMSWLIAEVDPESGSVPLEPRVYVEAEIQGRRLPEVAAVPRSALITNNEVWVVDEANHIRRQEVGWVYRDDESVYVTEGLESGQRVLEQGSDHLLEGAEIRVRGEPQPARGGPRSGRIVRDV